MKIILSLPLLSLLVPWESRPRSGLLVTAAIKKGERELGSKKAGKKKVGKKGETEDVDDDEEDVNTSDISDMMCMTGDAETDEMVKDSIFDPPTAEEMEKIKYAMSVFDFGDEGMGIELTDAPLAGPDRAAIGKLFGVQSTATTQLTSPSAIWGGIQTNYISRIDTLHPPKAEATAFLFGDGAMPERYAQVNVAFGALDEPKFVEYKIGPLSSTAELMDITRLNDIDQLWNSRPREGNEMRALKAMVDEILNEEDFFTICTESFAGQTHGNGLDNHELAPPGLVGKERYTQIRVSFAIEGTWRAKDLNAVPLSFTINNTDVDPSMWTAYDFWYNLQGPFERDELVDQYFTSDTFKKVIIEPEHFEEIQKSSFPQKRPEQGDRAFSEKPGPRTYMPEGPRYTVSGRTIKWMDWSFHAGYNFRAGPVFKNLMFKKERIAYEVTLNEIGLIYAANDPVGANVNFLDSNFGNGEYRELIRGVDCPDHATYLTNYWWAAPGGAQTAMRSVCVFETSKDEPLWRRGGPFVSGLPNTELHVRFIMPNGNYDYIVTYQFKLDGHVRVDIGSSGYIQGHFMPPDRGAKDSMAYRVHTYTGSSLHDHTFSFKVDLDVGGETNTFETVAYKSGKTLDAINAGRADEYTVAPEYFLFDTMRYVEYTTVEKEEDSLLSIDPAAPKTWLFGDTTNKNKWGSTKAYAIVLDANPSGLVDPASHTLPAFNFYKQMLAVTVYKDEEITSTGPYDLNRLDDPQVTFDKFVNGESIVQEDIVAWVTLSMHHLPTTENMPMTNSIKHGFVLAPHNFFDENPAMDLPHYLRMMDESDNRTEDLQAVPNCVPFEYDTTHTFSGV